VKFFTFALAQALRFLFSTASRLGGAPFGIGALALQSSSDLGVFAPLSTKVHFRPQSIVY